MKLTGSSNSCFSRVMRFQPLLLASVMAVLAPVLIPSPALAQTPSTTADPNAQNLEPVDKGAKHAPKPINPGLVQVPDVPGLPRVLIIGDSISMGYTPIVRAKLTGKANIDHPPENCGDTIRGLDKLDKWIGTGSWDVIHFNFGLHDLKYTDGKGKYISPEEGGIRDATPEVYAKNLREIATRLQKTGAKIIFATTTPVPPGTTGRVAGDEKVYNDVALGVMKELNIPIDDLGGYVAEKQKEMPPRPANEAPKPGDHRHVLGRPGEIQLPFNVHFTEDGYNQLADLVIASITKYLPPTSGK